LDGAPQPLPNELQRSYRDRALELLSQTLDLVPNSERAGFWRKYVGRDQALDSLRRRLEFRQLESKYARPAREVVL
jgi:hypothetical protein